MAATHDYDTKKIKAKDLDSTHVLVGECGGLSAVVGDVEKSYVIPGCVSIETEHGTLYIDPDEDCDVVVA